LDPGGDDSPSRRTYAEGFFLDQATINWTLRHYLRSGTAPQDPRVSPLRASDFRGLPPTHIHTAEFDPMRDEGRSYADRLARDGVPVRYTCHAGMIHLFFGMAGVIPYASEAMIAAGGAIREALAEPADTPVSHNRG
jgi:acetyl esterase/lipase